MISNQLIEVTAHDLMTRAGIDIPSDHLSGLKTVAETEEGDLSSFVLRAMLQNYETASEDRRPMCADAGVPRYYVKAGNEARIEGGFVALEHAPTLSHRARGPRARSVQTGFILSGAPITATTSALTHPRSNTLSNPVATGLRSRLSTRADCSEPTIVCYFRGMGSTESNGFSLMP